MLYCRHRALALQGVMIYEEIDVFDHDERACSLESEGESHNLVHLRLVGTSIAKTLGCTAEWRRCRCLQVVYGWNVLRRQVAKKLGSSSTSLDTATRRYNKGQCEDYLAM